MQPALRLVITVSRSAAAPRPGRVGPREADTRYTWPRMCWSGALPVLGVIEVGIVLRQARCAAVQRSCGSGVHWQLFRDRPATLSGLRRRVSTASNRPAIGLVS